MAGRNPEPASLTPQSTAPDRALLSPGVRRFRLVAGSGKAWDIESPRCSIGSHPSNTVVIGEATVSRFHCEIVLDPEGARIRDLESRNGTMVDGVRVADAWLRTGSELRMGRSALRFELSAERIALPTSDRTEMGPLVGTSPAMRTTFALLERAAASDATVLIEGETGTGKEGAVEALHQASARREKPLVVVDCGSLPANLIESELFGHEKGSFTGASARRLGAFEEADGGTIFLDEIGELPLDLQPKLLRVLERKEIRRVGTNTMSPIDVRVVAATHRDLRGAVNRGDFRSDLYYRLAVVRIPLPTLRSRLQDIPLLVERLLQQLQVKPEIARELQRPEFLVALTRSTWPGNVRELRNFLERCVVFQQPLPLEEHEGEPGALRLPETALYDDARRNALEEFERAYLTALLARHQGKVAEAAKEAGIGRVYLYKLLRKHGLGSAVSGG